MPKNSNIQIRAADNSDIPAIPEIYSHHVLHGTAPFEIDPPSREEMGRRLFDVMGRGLPYFVAVNGDTVVGFAYAAMYRTRVAYRFTLEDSVYIHHEHMGRGVGGALLAELIKACKAWGCRQHVAVIGDSGNIGSIRVHEKLGFQHAGVLKNVGFKFDLWLDSVIMQLPL